MKPFWVYILLCADNSFYVGHTDNLEGRLDEHQQGLIPTAYTHSRRPVELVFAEAVSSRYEAISSERQIKGWSRAKKAALVRRDFRTLSELARNRERD